MRDGEPGAEAAAVLPAAAQKAFSPDAVQLLRTTQAIQYQLSQMADQKASMLLGITFVIFTIAVGQARDGNEPLPLLILGGAAALAATLTVLAVLPAVGGPKPDAARNLLFFGAFTQLSEEEFVETLIGRMGETPAVFELFARDIYQNGRVLARKKYRLLGWAYRVLLAGLLSSAAAFIVPFAAERLGI